MKTSYRKTSAGTKVKYDSNPKNDYADGYNAATRRYKQQNDRMIIEIEVLNRKEKISHLVLSALVGALIVFLAVFLTF